MQRALVRWRDAHRRRPSPRLTSTSVHGELDGVPDEATLGLFEGEFV